MTDKIKELAKKYSAEIMAAREYFHANPGIEFQEFETTKKIIEILEEHGCPAKCVIGGRNPPARKKRRDAAHES